MIQAALSYMPMVYQAPPMSTCRHFTPLASATRSGSVWFQSLKTIRQAATWDRNIKLQTSGRETIGHLAIYSSDYIRQMAPYYGVDPNAAIAIFDEETGGDSNFIGDMGSSFGP